LPGEYDDEPMYFFDYYFYGEDDIVLMIDGFYKIEIIDLVD